MATTSAILDFLEQFGTECDAVSNSLLDVVTDNHYTIEFNEVQYYVPKNSVLYGDEEDDILETLVDNYLV